MKTSFRRAELLKAAADALRDGRNPFSDAFLAEHKVTFDQAMLLSESLAVAADMLLITFEQMASNDGLVAKTAAVRLTDALAKGVT